MTVSRAPKESVAMHLPTFSADTAQRTAKLAAAGFPPELRVVSA
jgi:hypothetical protein